MTRSSMEAEVGRPAVIRSMTGYGSAEVALAGERVLRAEVRTVNHRHLSVSASLPGGWDRLRAGVVEKVRDVLSRGAVSVSVACEGPHRAGAGEPVLDMERAGRWAELLGEAAGKLGLEGVLDVNTLAGLPGVLRVEVPAGEGDAPHEEGLMKCVEAALHGVIEIREAEGRRLEAILRRSIGTIESEADVVESLAPQRMVRERDRIVARVAALAGEVAVEEERLAREIAYLADKWDIAEEVARLRAHVALFLDTLDGGGDADGKAGKRLGFVVQEMHREANTIGAKANDAGIAAASIRIREELERLREQLENVE